MFVRRLSLGTAAVGVVILSACSDSTGASADPQVRFNLATSPAVAAAGVSASVAAAVAPVTITDGSNTLVVEQVQVVLREIELERAGEDDCAVLGGDSCERLEAGPILLDLPLTPGAVGQFTVAVDTGHYDEVELEVHKASSSDDAAFVAAHPDFEDRSIRVTGSFNGQAFTFYSDLDVEQEIDLSPPLVVGEAGSADLTLFADLDSWFRDEAGALIDPATANKGEPNESEVKNNIQNAFEAFEDADLDGTED
jgi:hypothetical protein